MRHLAPSNGIARSIVCLLRGASATALCVAAFAGAAQAQTTPDQEPAQSPTGARVGPGDRGDAPGGV